MQKIACLALSLWSVAAHAEDGLTLSGNTRVRYELIEGQARAGFNASDDLLNIRTTLAIDYRRSGLHLGAELWDSRAYASNAGTPISTNEVNALEPVQAYVAYDVPGAFGKGTKLGLQAGRFLLNIGSRRLVAADDYRNTTSGSTGLRADVSLPAKLSATVFYVLPQVRLPDARATLVHNKVRLDRESFDLVLWGGLLSKTLSDQRTLLEAGYFHLGERDRADLATRDRSLDTFGAHIYRDPAAGKADFDVEAYRQTGTVSASLAPTAAKLDVSAWFAHGEVGYSWQHPWKPHLSLELDYASGDDRGAKYGRFDTLFGMRRADFAPAGLYSAVGRTNTISAGVRAEVTPSKRLDAFAAYRPLWLAAATDAFSTTGVRDTSAQSGRFAGHQLEARARYWLIPKRLRLEWDGLLLAKGRFLESAPNAPASGTTVYNSFNVTVSY